MRKLWYDVTLPAPRAVVLSLHGGAEHGHEPVGTRSGSVWRSRRLVHAIRSDLHAEDVAIARLRFAVKGWNDPESPSPVADARWALGQLDERHAGLPVVLLGHSMGARTALAVADHPSVVGVVGMAPWFPKDEDVTPITGKRLVAAHGSRDRITSARATEAMLGRSAEVAEWVEFVPMGPLGHYMLTHQRRWNAVATRGVLEVLDGPGAG